jgi:hypothetical protein
LTPALVLLAATVSGGVIDTPGFPCAGPSTRAYFMMPTERYPNGAFGDNREWGGLVYDGEVYAGHVLTRDFVFEDTAPRLADFAGDCDPEIVVVESHESEGAQVAVYGLDRGMLRKIAATPPVGERFAWLALAGIGDFDRDGDLDIAFVREPDDEGVLEFWGFAAGGLTLLASAEGFSNHRFGAARVAGGARDCGDGAETVLADSGWTRAIAAWVEDGAVATRVVADDAREQTLDDALACR